MNIYTYMVDKIAFIVSKILQLILAVLVAVVSANILLRYVGHSLKWADELARLLFVWTSFLGMYIAYSKNEHPAFTLFVDKFVANSLLRAKLTSLLIYLLVSIFLVIVLYGGIVYINHAKIQTTAVLRISVGWMYSAAPVGVGLMLLDTAKRVLKIIGATDVKHISKNIEDIDVGDKSWKQ